MAYLQAVEGPLTGQKFVVPDRDRVIIGRYEIYDLVVPDPSISRKHFAVEKRADGFYVVDLGSLNGTQLNGHRVSTAKLEEDDRISAGQTVLAFHEAEGAVAAPAAAAPEADVEVLSDDDIITVDPDAAQVSPATIPMPVATPPEEAEEAEETEDKPRRKSTGREPAKTRRTYKKGSGKSKASKSAGRCAACGRKVTQEDVDTGDCAKTRLGFVCSRCIEKRQKSGEKGSLETFITERQKRRR
ncbi:MAG: FHA domain-containing protein [Planctomycetota bacterium]|jgi:pSer/pThr/pTyr-binding forkhead associated (FHA) protein